MSLKTSVAHIIAIKTTMSAVVIENVAQMAFAMAIAAVCEIRIQFI